MDEILDLMRTHKRLYLSIACQGGSDEHIQARLDPDSEMPDWVITPEGRVEECPK